MSLRQLKFKPKLQINSAAKNKSDENNGRSISKAVCSKDDVSSNSNPANAEAVKVEVTKEDNKIAEESTGLNDNVSVSFKDSEASNANTSIYDVSKRILEEVGTKSISESVGNVTPPVPNTGLHGNGSVTSPSSSEILVEISESSSDKSSTSQTQPKSVEGQGIKNGNGFEDNVDSSILSNSNKKEKSLLNYDILNKISSRNCQKINSQNHDRQIVLDKESKESLNDRIKPSMNDLTEKINDNKKSEKNKSLECEADDTCSVKVSKVLNKENLESSRNNKLALSSSKNNYGSKTTKRKKYEVKNTDTSPSKVSALQRVNFKPNVAALGKIRRPEKFTTSSYSKMGSLAKEQFLKKFGKQQEPDASKLTMMDLIFYNPSTNPMPQSSDKKLLNVLNNSGNEDKKVDKSSDLSPDKDRNEIIDDETDDNADDAVPVPQLKISADGKVIVAQESLVIKPSNNLDSCNFETVIDSELKKRKPVKNPNRCGWSHLDTIKFYKALNSLGCDFETMLSIFPERSRKNLKSKFKKEEKLHGVLINKVLSRYSEFDLTNVVRELEIDTVYKDTIKTCGRGFTGTEKRIKGRKKSLSSVVAGKSSKEENGDESDDSFTDEEFGKKKKKVDLEVLSKMSKVLGLVDENNSPALEVDGKLSNSESSDIYNLNKMLTTKRKRKKNREYVKSQTEIINDIVINTNIEFENVKYTRYISYNSNNLENPIEINETVAHVD